MFYFLATAISAVATFGLSWALLVLSRRFRLYPKIRERDMHSRPTPRLGGVAIFFGMLIAFAVASQVEIFSIIFTDPDKIIGLLVACAIIVALGVADDIWDIDWLTKLAGQIIAAGVLAMSGLRLLSLPILGGVTILPYIFSLVATILVIVLVMNAVNFIDGLDGLVAGVVLIASLVFFVYSYLLAVDAGNTQYFNLASLITAVLIGACIGFLPFNFHPAKMFMGDAGAMLIGLLMAASAISVTGQVDPITWGGRQLLPAFIPILLPLAVLVVPLLDFSLAVLRRLRAGKSPFAADRKHLHHRLIDMGHSHLQAVLIFYAWTASFSLGCLAFLFFPWPVATGFIGLGLVLCTLVTVLPLRGRSRAERDAELEPSTETESA